MAVARAHVFVSGYVQGVFFRHSMQTRAGTLGVNGWVRNLGDGRVEAVIEGEPEAVRALVAWCHDGPAHATVERVEVAWEPPTTEFSGFSAI